MQSSKSNLCSHDSRSVDSDEHAVHIESTLQVRLTSLRTNEVPVLFLQLEVLASSLPMDRLLRLCSLQTQ